MPISAHLSRLGITAALVVASAVPLAGSAMAASDAQPRRAFDCQLHLQVAGYPLTEPRVNACATGAEGSWLDWLTCYAGLLGSGVDQRTAELACNLSQD
ncbi:hypothetical protein [Umezawaea sp.]|uniref:hypothetical protein n=1 Tax=Umezawaea sp. TaxID=1955258 RepID=UPI002ED225B3